MSEQRPKTTGMHHAALRVQRLEACERFYVDLMGMAVEWRPDADNLYLCSGNDNLALHRTDSPPGSARQRLDHIGFIVPRPADVDAWHRFLSEHEVPIEQPPKTHRDGARSIYVRDPDGTLVQIIYHPPLA